MRRVLIIDDDPGTLETWSGILRVAGFDVLTAESGSEGTDMALRSSSDAFSPIFVFLTCLAWRCSAVYATSGSRFPVDLCARVAFSPSGRRRVTHGSEPARRYAAFFAATSAGLRAQSPSGQRSTLSILRFRRIT